MPAWLQIVLAVIASTATFAAAIVASKASTKAKEVDSTVEITKVQHEQWQKMLADERAGRTADGERHAAELTALELDHTAHIAAIEARHAAELAERDAVAAGQLQTIESLTKRRRSTP